METAALTRARRGALLAILAAALLANPLYVGLIVDQPRERSPTGYAATAVDPSTPEGRERILDAVGDDDVLAVHELADANEYSPYGDEYRASGAAAEALRRARDADGDRARVDAEDAAFTLGRVAANHRFVWFGEDRPAYYRLDVTRTDDGGAVVALARTNRSAVVEYLVRRDAVLYDSLPEYRRETVDAVIAADESGYRPYDDGFYELTDRIVVKDGTYYVFRAAVHVDDFGFGPQAAASALLTLVGLVALLGAVGLTAWSFRTAAGEDARSGERRRDEP